MTETPDPQLQLKKRARRRLVGAVAFAGLAAVILPMVMDEEPRRQVQDVPIRIPGQDQLPFKPKELPSKAAPPVVMAAGGEPQDTVAGGDSSRKATAPVPIVSPEAKPAEKTADKKLPKPVEKAADKKAPKAAEKVPEKAADKKVLKPAEKTPEKPAENKTAKPAEKTLDKPAEKKTEKPADKVPEKSPVKKVDQPADKPAETGSDDTGKTPADEASPPAAPTGAAPASAAPASKRPESAPAKTGGQHVILIGAFSNPENVKQLQGKIGGVGVNTYTETLDSPEGKKTRVRAGPFPNREAAEKALERLKKIGVNGVVAGRQ